MVTLLLPVLLSPLSLMRVKPASIPVLRRESTPPGHSQAQRSNVSEDRKETNTKAPSKTAVVIMHWNTISTAELIC